MEVFILMNVLISNFQGDAHRSQAEVYEAAPCVETTEDDQQGARPQSCVRLCDDLTEERF